MAICSALGLILLWLICSHCCVTRSVGFNSSAELVYQWVSLDYDWPNDTMKQEYISSGRFILENNILSGLKVYKGDVYVTVPRWREGVPASLNKVIIKDGKHVLKPFPDWESQIIGDCESLQTLPSMEVDPNLGWMWIIDTGRLNFFSLIPGATPLNLCPAKLLVYDLNSKRYIRRYEFPASVVSPTNNFINDIVVDYVDGSPRYAYITDTSTVSPGLVVYDFINNTSHRFTHLMSMVSEPEGESIAINNDTIVMNVPIDGIALSADSRFLYFCALTAYNLYQVPTTVIRNPNADFGAAVRLVGRKVSQTDGMVYGQNNLYFGALGLNAVYKWETAKDAVETQSFEEITMQTQTLLAADDKVMQWVETFAFDKNCFLWYNTGKLHKFFQGTMDFSETAPSNMHIWKVFVGEKGYLDHSLGCNTTLMR